MYTERVAAFFDELFNAFYPVRLGLPEEDYSHTSNLYDDLVILFKSNLGVKPINPKSMADAFFNRTDQIKQLLDEDLKAHYDGDPAAKSYLEVILSYPGFYAVAAYRVAHELDKLGIELIPRIITEYAHGKTGIDIHPSAKIGKGLCIDHGTGIVIGETSDIGNNVKIYQGVTLGAISVNKEAASKKRHPTIEDNVVIYAQATILGGDTVIGEGSVIGGNTWVTKPVAPFTKLTFKQDILVRNITTQKAS